MDKHFSSEEIKLVKRLPKTLQDRALKCLREQKIISESTKKLDKMHKLEETRIAYSSGHSEKLINGFIISESNKKTSKSKSKIRKSESSGLSRIQPISTSLSKNSKYQTPTTKRTYNKQM